jgi:GTP cyclohydrolase I
MKKPHNRGKPMSSSKAKSSSKRSFQDASNLMASVLETAGLDLTDENFDGTPERFVKYLREYTQPFNPERILKIDFTHVGVDAGYKGMLAQHNIPLRSICPHHLLPVTGRVHIGYIPDERLVGLSKLTRLVHAVGHELPRMQETITDLLADLLMKHLKARGVIVVVAADHGCMTGRGVGVHNVPTSTSTVRGLFRDVSQTRDEFFALCKIANDKN